MNARRYPFAFPYQTNFVEASEIAGAVASGQYESDLAKLPAAIQAKLKSAGPFTHPSFEKADFDALPDALWAKLAPHLRSA